MRIAIRMLAALTLLIGASSAAVADQGVASGVQPGALEFRLMSCDGQTVELTRQNASPVTVVCFLGAECPLARLYGPRLVELATEFEPRGVRFIGIDSNFQDSMDDIRAFVRD